MGSRSSGAGGCDDVLDELGDVGVAFDGDGDDAAGAGGDFLDVGEGLFVLEDAELGSLGSLVAMQTTGRVSSMRALGPCFISPAG
jgi:hypothetical protein